MSKRGNLLEEKRFRCDTFRICRELDPNALFFSRLVYLVFSRGESGGGSASCLYPFHCIPSLYRHPTIFSFSFAPKVFARERQSVLKCVNALQARTPASTWARGRDLSKTNSGFSSHSQRDLINESAREASTKSSLSRSSRDWVNKDAGPLIDHFD